MKLTKNPYIIPAVILITSFSMRMLLISKGPYHIDCLKLALASQETLDTFRLQMLSGLGFPLTVLLGSLFIFLCRLFSVADPIFAVNLMSVITSSLSVWIFYLLVKELLDSKTALFSSLLFCVSPIFLGLSVYGKSHTPSLLFLFLSLYFIILSGKNRRLKTLLTGAVFLACMGATRILDLALLAIPISFFILDRDRIVSATVQAPQKPLPFKNLFIVWFAMLPLLITFYLPLFLGNNYSANKQFFLNDVRLGLLENFIGIASPRLSTAFYSLNQNTTSVGLFLATIGFVLLFHKKRALGLFLFLWILCPLLFYGNLRMTVTSRYFVILLPALYIALGYALSQLASGGKIKQTLSFMIFLMLFEYSFLFIYPMLQTRHHNAILPAFAQWVEKNTEKHAALICADESLFFKYYTKLTVIGRPLNLSVYSEDELRKYQKKLDTLLDQNIPLYIHGGSLYAYNTNNQFFDFIYKNYSLRTTGTHFYEDWHKGAMELQVFPFELYKIEKK